MLDYPSSHRKRLLFLIRLVHTDSAATNQSKQNDGTRASKTKKLLDRPFHCSLIRLDGLFRRTCRFLHRTEPVFEMLSQSKKTLSLRKVSKRPTRAIVAVPIEPKAAPLEKNALAP